MDDLREIGAQQAGWQMGLLSERIAELELALEDREWMRVAWEGEREFSRDALRQINRLVRLFYLKNPLVRRGVDVQADYVWGQGVSISARSEAVNEVVQAFLDDARNSDELTGHQARLEKDKELVRTGNVFLVFFANRATGRVRVRSIPADEVEEIITNPDDRRETWFYRRTWAQNVLRADGTTEAVTRTALYPDWRFEPASKPGRFGEVEVLWESPVYQVRDGGTDAMLFGVSPVYPALDWARAYKSFLEDWATITRAYARFAWKMTAPGGSAGIAAAKAKLSTTLTATSGVETNPAPVTGSTFIARPGVEFEPVKTSGATTKAEDGRRLLLMVCAAFGYPETFFGDVSVGTLATAKSLDRPTELKIASRQALWGNVFRNVCNYAVMWAVRAPSGPLQGTVTADEDGTPVVLLAGGEDATVDVVFPPIVEHSITETIGSIISGATLDGKTPAGTMDWQTLSRLVLSALGVENADEVIAAAERERAERERQEEERQAAELERVTAQAAGQQMAEAARELRAVLREVG